jgi:hypothetical protein
MPEAPVLTRRVLKGMRPEVPAEVWELLDTNLRLLRNWVARPALRSRSLEDACRHLEASLSVVEVARAGLLRGLFLATGEAVAVEEAMRKGMADLGATARHRFRSFEVLPFEHALQVCTALNRMLFKSGSRLTDQQAMAAVGYESFWTLARHATWTEALLTTCAMGIENECPVRSRRLLVSLFTRCEAASLNHYRAAKHWLKDAVPVGPEPGTEGSVDNVSAAADVEDEDLARWVRSWEDIESRA